MKLHNLIDFMGAEKPDGKRGRPFQQGVNFRTICEKCNSNVLGSLYDPALVSLANSISTYLFSQIARPNGTKFRTNSALVSKAVSGHILSIGVDHFPRGEMGDALAEFVLDPSAAPPKELGIYYWLYPYWDQVSIRCFSYLVRFCTPPLTVSLLKFCPIAFMLTWDADESFNFPYPNLVSYISGGNGDAEIPLNFRIIPPHRYPEMPGKSGVALHGRDSYLATRHRSG